jgi:hypothetical protein
MRECPIFEVDITEERSTQVYIAATTAAEAEEIALKLRRELDWFSAVKDYGTHPYAANPNPADVRSYGVWVAGLNGGEGGWVHSLGDIPQLLPEPDPNQLVLDLTDPADLTDQADQANRAASRIITVVSASGAL